MRLPCKLVIFVASMALLLSCEAGRNSEPIQDNARRADDRKVSRLIDTRGTLLYSASLSSDEELRRKFPPLEALIIMRDPSTLNHLGGPYYDDWLGNLIRMGSFESAAYGGEGSYSVTFLHSGGTQIALDMRSDRVVDAIFEISRSGHVGILGNPDFESEIDCLVRRIRDGDDPLQALNICFSRGASAMGSGGGGLGLVGGNTMDRLAEPDCSGSGDRPGISEQTQQAGGTWTMTARGSNTQGDTTTTTRYYSRDNAEPGIAPDQRIEIESRNNATGDYANNDISIDYSEGGVSVMHFYSSRHTRDDGIQVFKSSIRVDGRNVGTSKEWHIDPATGECTGDCPPTASGSDSTTGTDASEGGTSGGASEGGDSDGTGTGSTGQPIPGCELDGTCPITDPRCAEPNNDAEALWDCVARTGGSPLQCLSRLRDGIFAASGCIRTPGPSGQEILDCPRMISDVVSDCLAAGGSYADCMAGSIRDAGAGDAVNENDDLLAPFRSIRSSDIGYIDTTEFGSVLIALCNRGVEQLCRRSPGIF